MEISRTEKLRKLDLLNGPTRKTIGIAKRESENTVEIIKGDVETFPHCRTGFLGGKKKSTE